MTMATSVFAIKLHASLGISETPYDKVAIFNYLDELDGNKDDIVQTPATFNSFVDKITVPGQPAEKVTKFKKAAKEFFFIFYEGINNA